MIGWHLFVSLTAATIVSVIARRKHWLTPGGTIAATLIGTIVFGFGGWRMAALLLMFFVSSSLLTRLHAARKLHPEHRRGRTAGQVLANGTIAALAAIWYSITLSPVAFAAFTGAIAASTADTWATEIGLLSTAAPRLITTWAKVPLGTSGAVTLLGTIGGIAGAGAIAFTAFYWMKMPVLTILAAGVIAMFADSALGATLEGRWPWMTNDMVNLISTASGAVIAGVSSLSGV